MKLVSALALNVAVVAAGLFVYDRWLAHDAQRGGAAGEDPMSLAALDRLEDQMEAVERRRHVQLQTMRARRISKYLERLQLTITRRDHDALAKLLDRFQVERLAFWKKPDTQALGERAYEVAYRSFIGGFTDQVRALVKDAVQADMVIQRFVFDGRIIRPTKEELEKGATSKGPMLEKK